MVPGLCNLFHSGFYPNGTSNSARRPLRDRADSHATSRKSPAAHTTPRMKTEAKNTDIDRAATSIECFIWASGLGIPTAESVTVAKDALTVELSDGRSLSAPLA